MRDTQTTRATAAEIDQYASEHPRQFAGQLWERCRCGAQPVYMPSHRCAQCIVRGHAHPRVSGAYAPTDTIEPGGAQ